MIIKIDKSVISKYGTSVVDKKTFRRFLLLAGIKECNVSLDIHCDIDNANLDIEDYLFLQEFINSNLTFPSDKRKSDCIVKTNGEQEFTKRIFGVEEICEYISSPAIIIAENGTNDGYFVRSIEKNFDGSIDFEKLLSESLVFIDNASGSGAANRVDHFLSIHHGKPKFLRCMVLVDGDKRYPTDTSFANAKKQQKDAISFSQNGITYHILAKRSQENYMPDDVFIHNKRIFGKTWADAYLHLSDEQKDFFYTASGFGHDNPSGQYGNFGELPIKIQQLFYDIGGNYSILSKGSRLGNFKDRFAELFFTSPYVNKPTLLKRTQHDKSTNPNELAQIAQEIRQLL